MATMVCFHIGATQYCLPVEFTRAVRRAEAIVPLPAPRAEVTGVIAGDPPLTVMSSLGAGGSHVLIVETGERTFGLLVDGVSGLKVIDAAQITPPPPGQEHPLVSGTVRCEGLMLMIMDADALAGRL